MPGTAIRRIINFSSLAGLGPGTGTFIHTYKLIMIAPNNNNNALYSKGDPVLLLRV